MAGYIGRQPLSEAVQSRVKYTSTAGQTSYSFSYQPGFVDVFLNGIKLEDTTDFIATNGTDIILTLGASAGQVLEAVGLTTFSLIQGKHNYDATLAPTVTDDSADGYRKGSMWIDTGTNDIYRCTDDTAGAAVWVGTTLEVTDLGTLATKSTIGTTDIDNGAVTATKLAAGAAVPTQTGQSGKFLKTDGTDATWATVDLSTKVDKVTGKALSANDFTTTLKNKLDGVDDSANNYSHPANHAISEVSGLQSALDAKTTPGYVDTKVSDLVDSAPATLNTLKELATALGDDANHVNTMTTLIGGKLPLTGGTMTGTIAGFTSTGIDDNATSTAITITDTGTEIDANLVVTGTSPQIQLETGASNYNWQIAAQEAAANSFEISSGNADGDATNDTYTPRLVIDSSGNVGIGTSSPTHPLSVKAASNAYAISMHGRSDGYSELYGASSDGSTRYSFLQSHSAQTKLYTLVNSPLLFGTNSTEHMRIHSNGGVAIGTTTAVGSGGILVDNDIKTNSRLGIGSAGTAGSPSLYLNGDTNTGIYFPAANKLGLVTGGVERLHIDSSGNVGIGTTSPDHTLVVRNTASSSTVLELSTAGSTCALNFSRDGNPTAYIRMTEPGALGTGDLRFGTGASASPTESMCITDTGKVGIGTSSPSEKLHISGTGTVQARVESTTGSGQLLLKSSTNAYTLGAVGNDFVIDDEGTAERMRIDSSGNVGIGTSSPSAPLEVVSGEIGNGANKGIRIANHNSSKKYSIRTGITGAENTSFAIHDDTASANRLVISTSGSVGIGTTSPAKQLDIFNPSQSWNQRASIGLSTESQGTYNAEMYYHRGTSNDSDRGLKFRVHDTLGMVIDSAGRVTMPYQPNFSAYQSSSYSIVSGQNVMQFSSTKHDNGNNFSTANNSFTAPVGGKYYFYAHFVCSGNFTANRFIIYFQKNGVDTDSLQVYRSGLDTGMGHSAVISLVAGDTIKVQIYQDSGSSKDVVGGMWNGFSGYLIG